MPRYGVWCIRGPNSLLGPGGMWYRPGGEKRWETRDWIDAQREATALQQSTASKNLAYEAREIS